MTREKVTAMRLAEALFPKSAERHVSYERGGFKGVGTWLGGRYLDGRKAAPTFYPIGTEREGRAWGRSWAEVVAGLRRYSASRRMNEARSAGFIDASFDAAAAGHDVREPCAQLFAWIHADPALDGI